MAIIEPLGYEKEERATISNQPGSVCIAVSGYANFFNGFSGGLPAAPENPENELVGDTQEDNDLIWIPYKVHLIVGPKWSSVRDVSPIVTVAGFTFSDNDSANASGVHIDNCTWDTVGAGDPNPDFEHIRLKVSLRMCGGDGYHVTKLAYHLIATGRAIIPD